MFDLISRTELRFKDKNSHMNAQLGLTEIVCALAEQSWAVKIELGYEYSAGTDRDCVCFS